MEQLSESDSLAEDFDLNENNLLWRKQNRGKAIRTVVSFSSFFTNVISFDSERLVLLVMADLRRLFEARNLSLNLTC